MLGENPSLFLGYGVRKDNRMDKENENESRIKEGRK
jgi:hypothetical protein